MTDKASIGIAGAGRMAQALGKLLRMEGFQVVCVASRTMAHAGAAAVFIGPGVQPVSYSGLVGPHPGF